MTLIRKNFNHWPHFVRLHWRSATATLPRHTPAFGIAAEVPLWGERGGRVPPAGRSVCSRRLPVCDGGYTDITRAKEFEHWRSATATLPRHTPVCGNVINNI